MLPEELCSISPIGRLEMFRSLHNTECVFSVQCVCACVCVHHIRSSDRVEAVTVTVCEYLCNKACHTRPPSVGNTAPSFTPQKSQILARYGPCTHPLGPYMRWTRYRNHNARNIPTHQSSSPCFTEANTYNSTIRRTSSLMPKASRMTSI